MGVNEKVVNIKDVVGAKIAIRCATDEEAGDFLKLYSKVFNDVGAGSLHVHAPMCFRIDECGLHWDFDRYYQERNYEIIEYKNLKEVRGMNTNIINDMEKLDNLIKEAEAALQKLKEQREAMITATKKLRVNKGETFYTIGLIPGGHAIHSCEDSMSPMCDDYFNANNYFRTKERAEVVAEKIQFLLQAERFYDLYCPDYVPDWDDENEPKCFILYDNDDRRFDYSVGYSGRWTYGVYYPTIEIAQRICDEMNREIKETLC